LPTVKLPDTLLFLSISVEIALRIRYGIVYIIQTFVNRA
jgi:hypothetical protein